MSTCAPWTLKNECANPTCKHEKDSHHQGKDNCLTLHCDCKAFKKAGEKEPNRFKKAGEKEPNRDWTLDVDKLVEVDEAPDTPKMPGWPWT